MSNGDSNETWSNRLGALFVAIVLMIAQGKRKAEEVFRWLETVQKRGDFIFLLDAPRSASTSTEPEGGWAKEWEKFYREVFDLTVDFSKVVLPAEVAGFGWAVFIPPGLTLNRAWAACRDRFLCFSFCGDDLGKAVGASDSKADVAYTKRLRNRVEADEELKNISANDLAKQKVRGITLLERITLELWYHWKTGGGHLDLVNWTLCAGSRYSDTYGGVPRVGWFDGRFRVDYCLPEGVGGCFRTRAAV